MISKLKRQPKHNVALGIDLGTSQIKAALVRKQGDQYRLEEYATRTLPAAAAKSYKAEEFSQELQQLVNGLQTSERRAFVTISCDSAVVCHAEFPAMPLSEIKNVLQLNSTKYLRRDFSNFYLDAFELPDPTADNKNGNNRKKKNVLVGGANKEDVDACRHALTAAKLKPLAIELAAVSVINAFHVSHPEPSADAVLLVDIGGRSTTMNFLQHGQPAMTRIMRFGGVQLSEYIAQATGLDGAEAETEKVKLNDASEELVRTALMPLARELRSSVDFFERQHDCRVPQAYACGASAASEKLLGLLAEMSGLAIKPWNIIESIDTSQFNGETPRLLGLGPSLAAAIGVALARLN